MPNIARPPEGIKTIQSSPPSYRIELFTQSDLLKQPFLRELQDVINTSYYDTGASPFEKTAARLHSDTQLTDELQETGFIAIAFAQNTIIGTASVKFCPLGAGGAVWKVPGYFEQFSADEIFSASSTVLDSLSDESQNTSCEGGFEIAAVAVMPDPRYRRKGIAASLVQACEEELKRVSTAKCAELAPSCITLKCIREVQGPYWLKRGFRIVGEQYCPPFTWGYTKGFVLWAIEKELPV